MFTISNHREKSLPDPKGGTITLKTYKPASAIVAEIRKKTATEEFPEGWPQPLRNGSLVVGRVPDPKKVPDPDAVTILDRPADLWAWLGTVAKRQWATRDVHGEGGELVRPVEKEDLFAAMGGGTRYDEVSQVPHMPSVPGVFYLSERPKGSGGEALGEFLDLMNAATEDDRKLLKACLLTTVAGLGAGQRPAFVFLAKKQGSGKTKTAETIAAITGGTIGVPPGQNDQRTISSFFSDDAMNKRVALIDNVKEDLDSPVIESLVTGQSIQGHKLYFGHASRPNYMTWIITANRPKVSQDLATRSVCVRLGPPVRGFGFEEKMRALLESRRLEILGDCMDILEKGAVHPLSPKNRIRFYDWEEMVLRRIEGCDRLAAMVKERQATVNADADCSEEIREEIVKVLRKCDEGFEWRRTYIPWGVLCLCLDRAMRNDRKVTKRGAGKVLRPLLGQGPLRNLDESSSNKLGKGLVWTGDKYDVSDETLDHRIGILDLRNQRVERSSS